MLLAIFHSSELCTSLLLRHASRPSLQLYLSARLTLVAPQYYLLYPTPFSPVSET